jgi:protein TonB
MPRSLKSLSTLQWALMLSALLHVTLLTIRFVDPEGFERAFQKTTLDVILVNAKSDEKPDRDKAQAIAQASLTGGGDATDKRIAATPMPPMPHEAEGDSAVNENRRQRRINVMLGQQEQLLAKVREQLAAMPRFDPDRQAHDPEARALEERRRQLTMMLAAIERRVREENSRPRKRYLSPATLGASYALYYDEMRHKLEARGTANFPQADGHKLYGELVMALLINHDGRILDARVMQSSGNRILDRLAEAIVQASAPFGHFTPEMRKDTDQLDISALFKFTHEMTLETTLQSDQLFDDARQLHK